MNSGKSFVLKLPVKVSNLLDVFAAIVNRSKLGSEDVSKKCLQEVSNQMADNSLV